MKIICSAIWYQNGKKYVHQPKNVDSGFVVCGRRHHNCTQTLSMILAHVRHRYRFNHKRVQGFLTDTNHFLGRRAAYKVALEAGQVITKSSRDPDTIDLYSEDLY